MEVVDGTGRLQGCLARWLVDGHYRIALAEAMPTSDADAGLYFLRLRLSGKTTTYSFFYSRDGSTGTVFAPPQRDAAPKRAATVDTLRISKTGYNDVVKEIASYTAGNPGDFPLTAALMDGWVNLFNGKDLTGWTPLIHNSKIRENIYDTFRADSVNNVIRKTYDKYPNQSFDDRCGLLYYKRFLTNYRVKATYRFLEPQAKNPVGCR